MRSIDEQVREEVARRVGLTFVGPGDLAPVLDLVRERHLVRDDAVWWWDALRAGSQRLPYGDADALAAWDEVFPSRDCEAYLVVPS